MLRLAKPHYLYSIKTVGDNGNIAFVLLRGGLLNAEFTPGRQGTVDCMNGDQILDSCVPGKCLLSLWPPYWVFNATENIIDVNYI